MDRKRFKAVSDYLATITISPTLVTTSKPTPSPTPSPTKNSPTNPEVTNTPINQAASVEDINNDGVINMAGAFNTIRGDSIYKSSCDLNNDGTVNMSDIIIIATKFNTIVRH